MESNLNVNANLYKWNTVKEYREDSPPNVVPCPEEITIMKTEVKEEVYDFEMPVEDMELVEVKEEFISSVESSFGKEDLEVIKSRKRTLNEDHVIWKTEFIEMDCQEHTYRCELCNSVFQDEVFLINHYQQCHLEQTLSKESIHLKGNNSVEVNTLEKCMLVKQGEKPKTYKCKDCKYATYKKKRLEGHIRTHTNEKPFKCTFKNCKCTPGQEELCKCEICEYAAALEYTLKMHIFLKHSEQSKKYKCQDCKYTTYKRKRLEGHIRTHTNERPFKCIFKNCKCTLGQENFCECDTCEYATAHQDALKMHILCKHSEKLKKYECKDCKYASHRKSDLVRHGRIHTNERPFKCTYKYCKCPPGQEEFCNCDTCGYAAKYEDTLKMHISLKHSEETKLKCKDCEYATHNKQYLKLHARTHTNDKPFKCTYKNCKCSPEQEESCKCNTCEYAATRKDALKSHIKIKHSTGPKKYKCGGCVYSARTKRNLARHICVYTHEILVKRHRNTEEAKTDLHILHHVISH